MFRKFFVAALFGTAFLTPALAAYPEKPIRIIVAWPPGGVTDTIGRIVAEKLTNKLNVSVVVENRAGANGIIGTQTAARAKPDGYTMQVVTAESHAINPYVYKDLAYHPLKSFDPVALLGTVSFVLAESRAAGFKDAPDLVAAAKAKTREINAGSYGVGSTSHLGLALFQAGTKTQFSHVPYQGVAPVVNALLANEIDFAFVNAFNVSGFAQDGRLKILGVASDKRLAILPDVPTLVEQGIPGVRAGNWYGVALPHGVSADIRGKLEGLLREISRDQTFSEKLRSMGVEERFLDSAGFGEFIKDENDRLSKVIKDQGISAGS